jgi:response regulator RpfG family c-di-GMP phosphodiesterase
MHLDAKALLYAGLLHDVGKLQTKLSTLQKTEGWLPADTEEIKNHVVDGYRVLRDCFDFTAEIILWHHRFQPGRYPESLPQPLHDYSEGTRVMIPLFGRLLSLADVFDALHRVNDKHGLEPLTGEDIKAKMLACNPDQRVLIEEAYEAGIFTTVIV